MASVKQFAKEVISFSSQYGSETSLSYIAANLAGSTNIHPNYGDFTQALVFRTYGPWWQQAPSALQPFSKTSDTLISHDFVELKFHDKVYPSEVRIYETYNPGAVVRILALKTVNANIEDMHTTPRWYELWSGAPQNVPPQARIFTPSLNKIDFPTNIIRLEFNQSHLEYYTELDAIELVGTLIKDHEGTDLDEAYAVHMMKNMQLNEQCDFDDIIHSEFPAGGNNGFFDVLPGEVIQLILTYLDILSLGNVALTCRLFYKHCYDPLQYVELDLQSYWTQIDDSALDGLNKRCHHLQRLNMSWTGGWGKITPECFCRFVKSCGSELITLRLACCQFLNEACIKSIADYCPLLQELNLQSCTYLSNDALRHIRRLTHLNTLNLYRSSIGDPTLINILSNLPDLEHLNLGSCVNLTSLDNVVTELCGNWKKLRSLDLWRAKTISHIGLRALANNCPRLAELDLGWCSEINSNTQCFIHLVQNCTELRKLFLTANRSLSDADMHAIADNCRHLEQLDILGNRMVSSNSAHRILENCRSLTMFDVSFCLMLDFITILDWKEIFPHVSIQKSYTH